MTTFVFGKQLVHYILASPLHSLLTRPRLAKGLECFFSCCQDLETPSQLLGESALAIVQPGSLIRVWGLGRGGEVALVIGRSLSVYPGKKAPSFPAFPRMD